MQRSRLYDIMALVVLALLPLVFWWQLWTPKPTDQRVIPEGDFSSQYYPLQQFAARELLSGRLPSWNPFLNGGQPALADPQTGAFYPLNLLPNMVLAWLGLDFTFWLLQGQIVLHFCLASIFTFLLVRRLAERAYPNPFAARVAGATAALTFTYGGYLTSFPVQQLTILETSVWLPLILFFEERAIEQGSWREALYAAAGYACALLAGHPQTVLYLSYALLIYGAALIWTQERRATTQGPRGWLPKAGILLGSLAGGAALAAVQILPSLRFVAASTRTDLGYADVAHGFSLDELTHLLYPGFFGGSPQFVGIVPLVLAIFAIALARKRVHAAIFVGLGSVALLLAFGGNTFAYTLAYLVAPGFSYVRNQERIVFLFSFSASVLAGLGMAALAAPIPRRLRERYHSLKRWLRLATLILIGLTPLWYFGSLAYRTAAGDPFAGVLRHHALLLAMLVGLWGMLALRRRRHRMALLGLGLIWLHLSTVNGRYNLAPLPENGSYYPESGIVEFLWSRQASATEPFRISSAGLLPGGASAASVYELEDITANTPLRFSAFARLERNVEAWQRWQLLNVLYVLDTRDLDGPGLERVFEEGEVRVYRMADPLPRAWFAREAEAVSTESAALATIQAPGFDPRRMAAVLSAMDSVAIQGGTGTAQVVDHAPGRVLLEARSPTGGVLVVSQIYDSGWHATLDGEPVPLLQTDFALQGVVVPSGTHHLELHYTPETLRWGAIVSSLTLAAALGSLLLVSVRSLLAKGRL